MPTTQKDGAPDQKKEDFVKKGISFEKCARATTND